MATEANGRRVKPEHQQSTVTPAVSPAGRHTVPPVTQSTVPPAGERPASQDARKPQREPLRKKTSKSSNEATKPQPGGTIGELVAKITSQFSALVRDEIKYTKLQAKSKVTSLGKGGVMLLIAGILALYMLGLIFAAIAWAFALLVPTWAGYLITAGILLLVILILALLGIKKLKKASLANVDPKDGLTKNVDAIKKGLEK